MGRGKWNWSDNFLAKFPERIDSLEFFESIKLVSEKQWENIELLPNTWGYQIQQGSKWRPGLTESEIHKFEEQFDFNFPPSLKNFYLVMNGLTKPEISIGGEPDISPKHESKFYSLPNDIALAEEYIKWIYDETHVTKHKLQQEGISRIFPIYAHRFMLIDHPNTPILSMYGDDIIYWADNIGELLAIDIFNYPKFHDSRIAQTIANNEIKFWLDFNE